MHVPSIIVEAQIFLSITSCYYFCLLECGIPIVLTQLCKWEVIKWDMKSTKVGECKINKIKYFWLVIQKVAAYLCYTRIMRRIR